MTCSMVCSYCESACSKPREDHRVGEGCSPCCDKYNRDRQNEPAARAIWAASVYARPTHWFLLTPPELT